MYKDYIGDDENILEIAYPDKFIYTFWNFRNGGLIIFFIIWILFLGFIGRKSSSIFMDDEFVAPNMFFQYISFIMFLIPAIIFIVNPIIRFVQANKMEYIITDKRVYIFSGVIGTDIQSIEYREIDKLNVNIGILEKFRNKGTIQLTPDQKYYKGDDRYTEQGHRLIGIDKPYEIYKLLNKNTLDVVTDQQFPNKYRPDINKGYNTKLDNNK